ncbi:MAG: alpha/beta fold hydrolase [Nitrosomonadaceae bacterium]|nr:alpha/beta hydrolase [Nitrosospira sp.]MDW7565261.1 alpha/beta fold hydrolase [Nitrosomonadaceae bacterium]MBI0410694.1 alpha/beta hydrolase [Nitrosospira sp.]MBI0411568.1 alpha/beta hydrolase [Nitrosospira sp.]MBI0420132.1 alpha/beta hydrolase [Nitrosospira sp.]
MKSTSGIELSGETLVKETVVLIHGLWASGWIMTLLGRNLRRCGFDTVIFSYPSMRDSLSQNALSLSRFVSGIAATRIHLVGHSLGGLLALQMLSEHSEPRIGRVILMGSPYHASYAAIKLARIAPGRWLIGSSMRQWLMRREGGPSIQHHEIGSIAGRMSVGIGKLLGGLPAPNDGVVTVEETRLPIASDWIVININHAGMLFSRKVVCQVCAFLRQGYFLHSTESK